MRENLSLILLRVRPSLADAVEQILRNGIGEHRIERHESLLAGPITADVLVVESQQCESEAESVLAKYGDRVVVVLGQDPRIDTQTAWRDNEIYVGENPTVRELSLALKCAVNRAWSAREIRALRETMEKAGECVRAESEAWQEQIAKVEAPGAEGLPRRGIVGKEFASAEFDAVSRELIESNSFLDALFNASPLAIFVADAEAVILKWNRMAERMFGWSVKEIVGKKLPIFSQTKWQETVVEQNAVSFPAGFGVSEVTAVRKDGTPIPISLSVAPLSGKYPSQRMIAVAIDVSTRHAMEDSLRASEERYRTLFESSAAGVFRCTLDGKVLDCNTSLARMLGYQTPEDVSELSSFRPDGELEHIERVRETLLREGCAVNEEFRAKRRDGTEAWMLVNVKLLEQKGIGPVVLGTTLDITEHRTMQQQMLQMQKMEAIGQLVGGIAHDFNNLLMILSSYSELLESEIGENHPGRESLTQIRKAVRRSTELIQKLLAFSRKQVLTLSELNLNDIVKDMEQMLLRILGEDLQMSVVCAADLGTVRADRTQIEQVIMNLALNARDAMPRGGMLTIETKNAVLDSVYARMHPAATPGEYVALYVSDNGSGISPEAKDRIFDPFFTTKPKGKGTGLGLSTAYGIVKQSGGYIWVYSEVGYGTTFKIYLPRICSTEGCDLQIAQENRVPVRGHETILVVEDEPSVRESIATFMRARGYKVLQAGNGREAISVSANHSGPIHLLITDVVMPAVNGPEAAAQISGKRSDIRVLYLSGYADSAVVSHNLLARGENFIQKPCKLADLEKKVREMLDSESSVHSPHYSTQKRPFDSSECHG